MNQEQIANILSLVIPFFFFALWILIPVAIIWGTMILIKRKKAETKTN